MPKKGCKMSEEHKIKIGLANKGRIRIDMIGNDWGFVSGNLPWNKGIKEATNTGRTHFKKGVKPLNYVENIIVCEICELNFHYKKCKKNRRFCSTKCQKIWESRNKRGENNPNWKGGKGGINKLERNRKEIKDWRIAVFQRDGYKCQHCEKIGGELNAHHIKMFVDYPELRFDVDNGITLCVKCHRKVHTKE